MSTNSEELYTCTCGEIFPTEDTFNQHKTTACQNRNVICSFCKETFPSSESMGLHLISCGNKTDPCPNCRKYIRRAIFAYHYENNCANPDDADKHDNESNVNSTSPPNRSKQDPSADDDNFSLRCKHCHEIVGRSMFDQHQVRCSQRITDALNDNNQISNNMSGETTINNQSHSKTFNDEQKQNDQNSEKYDKQSCCMLA